MGASGECQPAWGNNYQLGGISTASGESEFWEINHFSTSLSYLQTNDAAPLSDHIAQAQAKELLCQHQPLTVDSDPHFPAAGVHSEPPCESCHCSW
jgi:hypothetical protein